MHIIYYSFPLKIYVFSLKTCMHACMHVRVYTMGMYVYEYVGQYAWVHGCVIADISRRHDGRTMFVVFSRTMSRQVKHEIVTRRPGTDIP